MNLETAQKSERISVRTSPTIKRILLETSATTNKTVTEFLFESLEFRALFSQVGPSCFSPPQLPVQGHD